MRLYRGSKFAFYRRVPRWQRELLKWVVTLKPGDVFGACTGLNHYVKEIKIHWRRIGRRSRFIEEVCLIDTTDRWHWAPGGGCVCKPYTVEEIKTFFIEGLEYWEENGWDPEGKTRKLVECFKADIPVLDSNGVLLPDAPVTH
jgi:hypothetical protein